MAIATETTEARGCYNVAVSTSRTLPRIALGAVVLVAVGYFPLAFTSFWHFFDAGAPRLQDALQGRAAGHDFAYGHGSVVALRAEDYRAHRVVMLVHTSTGALALALATLQYSARLRRRPGVHRWTGRTYLLLMGVSMAAAYAFLLAAPQIAYFGGSAFDLQLWVLATSTVTSAAIALVAIRRRDLVSHRAWIGMNLAFMLTAPLLRLLWVGLGRLDHGIELMVGLDVGASTLGVVAPAGGAIAFLLTQPSRRVAPVADARRQYVAAAIVSVAGSCWLAARFAPLPAQVPGASLWIGHVVPATGLVVICLLGALRSARRGRGIAEGQWRALLWGAALATPSAALTTVLATPVYGTIDGFLAGTMVGASGPIVLAFLLVVRSASQAGLTSSTTSNSSRSAPVATGLR
ncbi:MULTISPECIES: DUF2306 domain-containing protein [unclassified Nocardioides]|uniref:DUF2306 domain-containing protein n=1 Tax=unclassified Nocardioides TaxID=2615069 RepID=UPI000702F579|nr:MULTISPECIES: DUF2306 domain-containing protein [unclassified Nocardioides]KRC53985.1 hypothetical protein ASE19_07875 [Nocardioides sp. Root79]KRC71321.1 hypothetical protein ASE20_10290 [Nocardioides sp. Root240]